MAVLVNAAAQLFVKLPEELQLHKAQYALIAVHSHNTLKYIKYLMSLPTTKVDEILYDIVQRGSCITITPSLRVTVLESRRRSSNFTYTAHRSNNYKYEDGKWIDLDHDKTPIYLLDNTELDEYLEATGYQEVVHVPSTVTSAGYMRLLEKLPPGTLVDMYGTHHYRSSKRYLYKLYEDLTIERIFINWDNKLYQYAMMKNLSNDAYRLDSIVISRYWLPLGTTLQEV